MPPALLTLPRHSLLRLWHGRPRVVKLLAILFPVLVNGLVAVTVALWPKKKKGRDNGKDAA